MSLLARSSTLSILLWASIAHAGPVENMAQVALAPGDPNTLVVRFENGGGGLFYTRDGGESWQLLCASAIGAALRDAGKVALTSQGKTLMGLFDGMQHDDGQGCAWSAEASFDGQTVADFAPHPSDAAITFAVTTGSTQPNGIWRRGADGVWSEVGTREAIQIKRLHVATVSTGLRFYQSTVEGSVTAQINGVDTELPNYVIRFSDDEGQTWVSYPFAPTDGEVRLQAVDPTNPDRVIVSIDRQNADDTLLISSDRGQTFSEYQTLSEFKGLAMAPDGRLWIGDAGDSRQGASPGLFFAASLDAPAQLLADIIVKCVAYEAMNDRVYACQNFKFGTVATDGTFSDLFAFSKAQEFISCPGVEMARACEAQLCVDYCAPGHFASTAPLCEAYDKPTCGPCADGETAPACIAQRNDAGPQPPEGDAMVHADAGTSCRSGGDCHDEGCTCTTVGARASRSLLPSLGGLGVALLWLQRRKRHSLTV